MFELSDTGPAGTGSTAGGSAGEHRRPGSRGAAVLARQLARALPGPASAALAALYDPGTCEPTVTVDLLVAWERLAAWVAAQQQRCLAALPVPPPERADEDWAREEVAAALRLSAGTAQDRLDVARSLARRLPATLRALQDGEIRYWQAAAVTEAVEPLSEEAAAQVERQVLRRAGQQKMGETRRTLRRAVLVADPASAALRHQRAMRQRGVTSWPTEDGMGQLTATLSAEGLATVLAALDAVADRRLARLSRSRGSDGAAGGGGAGAGTEAAKIAAAVPADTRRADALVEIALAALADPDLPRRQGVRPQIVVTVPASTLLGLDETPGELSGYGAISAAQARRIAATGDRHQRPNTSAEAVYEAGRYRPPAALRRFLLNRDASCRFPGCSVPAYRCDLDHTEPYGQGGSTNAANLAPLCRRHHRAKTHGGWSLTIDRAGVATWASPTGHRYRTERSGAGTGAGGTGAGTASSTANGFGAGTATSTASGTDTARRTGTATGTRGPSPPPGT